MATTEARGIFVALCHDIRRAVRPKLGDILPNDIAVILGLHQPS
jgi:hypothetical protein